MCLSWLLVEYGKTTDFGILILCAANIIPHPGQVAQLVEALSLTPKGCGFDSWLGYIPKLQVRSPVRHTREATGQCFSFTLIFLSLSHQ